MGKMNNLSLELEELRKNTNKLSEILSTVSEIITTINDIVSSENGGPFHGQSRMMVKL